MKDEKLLILKNGQIAKDTYEMVLQSEYISQKAFPGQFLHIAIPHKTLRRPLSIADINPVGQTVTIIYKIIGQGTKQLSNMSEGEYLQVMGPNGNHFPLNIEKNSTILLVGGGVGIPPLHFLGKTLSEQGVKIKSILGFKSAGDLFYDQSFKSFSETYIVTEDGTAGNKGLVTHLLNNIASFDFYYTCGPLPMIKAVTEQLREVDGFISLEERMGCGIGACYACVIPTIDGMDYRKICEDGPVFPAQEVKL